jgi:hypothetical protein
MKKGFVMMAVLALVALAAMIVFIPSPAVSQEKSTTEGPALPDSVSKIIMNSCAACHTSGGNGMACSHVNFSNWQKYTPDKQSGKAQSICKVLTKGSMPPKKFRESHPDAVPTEQQVKTICNWAQSLKKK